MDNLPWLPWLLIAIALSTALALRRRAPAVALGLVGAVVGGWKGYGLAHGGRVPSHVAGMAVIGLVVLGMLGLAVVPTATPRHLVRAAGVALVAGAIAIRMTWSVMHDWTCNAYDPPSRRWCGGVDLFYGISGKVTIEMAVGAIVLVGLFLGSALKAREGARGRPGMKLY